MERARAAQWHDPDDPRDQRALRPARLRRRAGRQRPVHPATGQPDRRSELLAPEQRAKAIGLDERPLGPARFEFITGHDFYTAALDGRARALVNFGSNLVIAQGDSARGRDALAALDFMVHADMFLSPTADLADIVLPVAMPFEVEALRLGFEVSQEAQSLVQLRRPVQAPRGEARSGRRSPSRRSAPAHGRTSPAATHSCSRAPRLCASPSPSTGRSPPAPHHARPTGRDPPDAVAERAIAAGDWVRIVTANGAVRGRARLNSSLDPGVVCGQHGWWQGCAELGLPGYPPYGPHSANLNLILRQTPGDPVSGSSPLRASLYEVERVEAPDAAAAG